MPTLNEDICYAQQEKRLAITVPENLSAHWLTEFYELLAVELSLDNTEKQEIFDSKTGTWVYLTAKEIFFKDFNKHAGPQSSYSSKSKLLESLRTLYCAFIDPKTTANQRSIIACKIQEEVAECSQGFHDRVNFVLFIFNNPKNMDELLAKVRFSLVDQIANATAQINKQGIHVQARFFAIAQVYDFGVWAINEDDIYLQAGSSKLSDQDIANQLEKHFSDHYGLFSILNELRNQIESLVVAQGYNGKYQEGQEEYRYGDRSKFVELIKPFITINDDELFEMSMAQKTLGINWKNINRALLKKFSEEGYVHLSREEATLLANLPIDENRPIDPKTLTTLIPNGHELAECLEFFSEWMIEQKIALVIAYLKDKTAEDQEAALAILTNQAPQLTIKLLKSQAHLRQLYFSTAIQKNNVASVKTCVQVGADINAALPLLFREDHKSSTLYWLHDHPALIATITSAGMNATISKGKYQGKTIAETLTNTKKGRQLLLENPALQTLLPETLAHRSDYLKQANAEKQSINALEGFFKKVDPLAMQLGQYIVYGDLTKTEKLLKELLKTNPKRLEKLLTEKVTVTDYSRRQSKKKTPFQAALCAWDDELCKILVQHMSQDEIARQYQEIFPEGHQKHFDAQTPFNFSAIVDAITSSNEADLQQALNLEPNNTVLWRKLEQFRADFTERSYQEAVFNPKHLMQAFKLYDQHFNSWSWSQRDLFWRQVIGYTQRFLPANIAMDFARGRYYRVDEKSNRIFNFRFGECAIFPLLYDSLSELGYTYAAAPSGRAVPEPKRLLSKGVREASRFNIQIIQKIQPCETYTALSKNENLHHCMTNSSFSTVT